MGVFTRIGGYLLLWFKKWHNRLRLTGAPFLAAASLNSGLTGVAYAGSYVAESIVVSAVVGVAGWFELYDGAVQVISRTTVAAGTIVQINPCYIPFHTNPQALVNVATTIVTLGGYTP